ncbi:hypothetical protein F4809DRAFT_598130 [Biscogniauxia mediterranea]|nr:hypothetical protein F4809DRAFT_598130 [Biscogniauxia mediterranea]
MHLDSARHASSMNTGTLLRLPVLFLFHPPFSSCYCYEGTQDFGDICPGSSAYWTNQDASWGIRGLRFKSAQARAVCA